MLGKICCQTTRGPPRVPGAARAGAHAASNVLYRPGELLFPSVLQRGAVGAGNFQSLGHRGVDSARVHGSELPLGRTVQV